MKDMATVAAAPSYRKPATDILRQVRERCGLPEETVPEHLLFLRAYCQYYGGSPASAETRKWAAEKHAMYVRTHEVPDFLSRYRDPDVEVTGEYNKMDPQVEVS